GTSVEVCSNAAALITTPASAKIYRSAGATSQITCDLKLGEGASLEWLPQDTVLFGGSRVHQATTV
ncbi:MAG TPA: urease accessory protein, partial [Gammaproteobacteria bacterium]|nr:urease accessory protein [Gammaproteobacteria bacterium]